MATQKAKVAGKIVLVGKAAVVPVNINPPAKRRDDEQLRAQYDPDNPERRQVRPRRPRRGPAAADDGGADSTSRSTSSSSPTAPSCASTTRRASTDRSSPSTTAPTTSTKAVPTVVMRNEDYGRIARILADGTPVELEFNIVNTVYPEGQTAYNTIAEIPGSDKKDEVVMLGGHLDSWHVGDRRDRQRDRLRDDDGGGAHPEGDRRQAAPHDSRRAVERRGGRAPRLAGVREAALRIVREHPKPEFAKLDAYLNIDSGTGRARGASVFGPPAAAAIVRQALAPFEDLGVVGASATTSRDVGGTDSTSFNNAGLPGIGFSQDPIEYNTHTHHTNLDNYERDHRRRREGVGDRRSRRRSISSRCATRCCRASARPRCRRRSPRAPAAIRNV